MMVSFLAFRFVPSLSWQGINSNFMCMKIERKTTESCVLDQFAPEILCCACSNSMMSWPSFVASLCAYNQPASNASQSVYLNLINEKERKEKFRKLNAKNRKTTYLTVAGTPLKGASR